MYTKANARAHYQFSREFSEICHPLFSATPITFCSIGRIFLDGTYTSFMSDPIWTEHYLSNHYSSTLKFWLEAEISQADSGYSLWSLSSVFTKNEALASLQNDCHLFGYNNGVNIIDKHHDYYEVIRFSSPKIGGIENYFLDSQDLLRNFILYLKDKIESDKVLSREFISHHVLPSPIDMIGNMANDNIPIPPFNTRKFYLGFPLKNSEYLTRKEMHCLLPFILGVPKKTVAKKLNTSTRTIEAHINNIKEKSICDELSMLRTLFFKNKYISILIPNTIELYF